MVTKIIKGILTSLFNYYLSFFTKIGMFRLLEHREIDLNRTIYKQVIQQVTENELLHQQSCLIATVKVNSNDITVLY